MQSADLLEHSCRIGFGCHHQCLVVAKFDPATGAMRCVTRQAEDPAWAAAAPKSCSTHLCRV